MDGFKGHPNNVASRLPANFIPGEALPISILGGPDSLSEEGKRKLKQLSGPRPVKFLIQLAVTWATIATIISVAIDCNHPITTVAAIYLVGTRQNLLGLLVHEQVHYLCARNRWADAVTNLFAAWPLVALSVENYAQVHLAHHSYFFTEKDPDFFRKNGEEWTFPMRVRFLCWLFFKDLVGGSFISLILGKSNFQKDLNKRPPALPKWIRPFYFLGIGAAVVYWGVWKVALLYWVVPLVTVFPVIVRFGAICEHKYNVASGILEESTAIIVLSWWEKLLLPNLNFNYHIYHHYYPGIAFSNLPKVHTLFKNESLVDDAAVFRGYYSYLRHLLSPTSMKP